MKSKKSNFEELIQNRSARTPQRKGYLSLSQTLPIYIEIIKYLSLILESEFLGSSLEKKIDYKQKHKNLQKILTLSERMNVDVSEGNFGPGVHKFLKEFKLL